MSGRLKVTIFLPCYNEAHLIPHTVSHYRRMIPSCDFVVFDNGSSDESRSVARKLGCEVSDFDTNGIIDEFKLRDLKNNCWRGSNDDWVVVCDMDEWLCADEDALIREDKAGNTMLRTIGFDIVDNSSKVDISDIDPQSSSRAIRNRYMDKVVCFKPTKINEMNYDVGAHTCRPTGEVRAGGVHLLKHMNWLGFSYHQARNKVRFERSEKMRGLGLSIHYVDNEAMWTQYFRKMNEFATDLKSRCDCFCSEVRPASPASP